MINNVKILDCTLRDGGYINNWNFGELDIKSIIKNLTISGIEIIECGFLEDFELYRNDYSLFNDIDQIQKIIPDNIGNTEFVAMTRFGKLCIENLKSYDGGSVSGIRVTFHLDEMKDAMDFCKQVKAKGYKVFVQPVGTASYSDEELLLLVQKVNELTPYSFYIVDTLGTMTKKDVHRMFHLIDHNLNPEIAIGFHSHNNLQLSFSNAQELISFYTERTIFIDSSVYGMGRGAGNLNTELIAQYINISFGEKYDISYILQIIDESISRIRLQYDWGYSVPYYLAAIHNCHPNYATFLINKKTLQVSSIAQILDSIAKENRDLYDRNYIEELYLNFQSQYINDEGAIEKLKSSLSGKKVLIIAPGKSVEKYKKEIDKFIDSENPVVILVQFLSKDIKSDFVFFSNRKRVEAYKNGLLAPNHDFSLILTSNISEIRGEFTINYSTLLNSFGKIKDNATLMLLNLVGQLNVKEVIFAGFDGYSSQSNENYIDKNMETYLDDEVLNSMNHEITHFLDMYSKRIKVSSITPTVYLNKSLSPC